MPDTERLPVRGQLVDRSNEDAAARLLEYLRSPEFALGCEIEADTPLLDSELLDSLGLFRLAMWIEEELGAPVELGAVDVVRDWNTVDRVATYIKKQRVQV